MANYWARFKSKEALDPDLFCCQDMERRINLQIDCTKAFLIDPADTIQRHIPCPSCGYLWHHLAAKIVGEAGYAIVRTLDIDERPAS